MPTRTSSGELEIACQELVELVTEYLESSLPSLDRALFETHLLQCDGCQTYIEQMRQTIRLAGALDALTIPDDTRDRLLGAFRAWNAWRVSQ